jgi:hypothetical protein
MSLYAATDHLLLRVSSGFVETYRRFYFADIEAITVRTTVRRTVWNFVHGIGLLVSLMVIWLSSPPHFTSAFFAGLFALLLIWNIALGKSCATQLQTRVQKRDLPIRRLRKALRVIDQLSSKIQMAQAEVALATPAQTEAAAVASVRLPASASSEPPLLPGEKPVSGRGWLHAVVFAALLFGGIIEVLAGLQHTNWLRYSACAALFLNLLVGIFGLLLQRRFRLWRRPSIVVWISFIAHALALPTIYFVYSMIYSFQKVSAAAGSNAPPSPFSMQMPLSALGDLPGFDAVLLVVGIFCVALALAGYFAMLLSPWRVKLDSTP